MNSARCASNVRSMRWSSLIGCQAIYTSPCTHAHPAKHPKGWGFRQRQARDPPVDSLALLADIRERRVLLPSSCGGCATSGGEEKAG